MAKNIFDTIVSVGGFSGEYEALVEAEISAAAGAAYSPPEEFDNFRVVDTRTVQLLGGSPMFFETFQTSSFTIRVPSGLITSNDATDGRIYFVRNSGSGILTIETSGYGATAPTFIARIAPNQTLTILHSDNDVWSAIKTSHPIKVDTVPPDPDDDILNGYEEGWFWVDILNRDVYVLVNSTATEALWRQINTLGNPSRETPKETLFGSLLDYPTSAGATSGEVQYIRIWFQAQSEYESMRVFVDSGGTSARDVRMGIYDQTDPLDPNLPPNNLVASTLAGNTNGDDGTFKTLPLQSNYIAPETGYYWLAVVQDSASLKLASSAPFRADYLPVRRQSGTGTTLPATASSLSNPVSSLIYVSAVEV